MDTAVLGKMCTCCSAKTSRARSWRCCSSRILSLSAVALSVTPANAADESPPLEVAPRMLLEEGPLPLPLLSIKVELFLLLLNSLFSLASFPPSPHTLLARRRMAMQKREACTTIWGCLESDGNEHTHIQTHTYACTYIDAFIATAAATCPSPGNNEK